TPGTAPGELNALRAQIASLRGNLQGMTGGGPEGGLGPNNPRVKALQAQVDELSKQLRAEQDRMILQAKEAFLAAKATEEKTEQELETRRQEAYRQGDDLVQLSLIQREFEQNRALYDGLEQRLQTAKLQAGLDAAEVDVIDAALPPVAPTLQPNSSIITTNIIFFLL